MIRGHFCAQTAQRNVVEPRGRTREAVFDEQAQAPLGADHDGLDVPERAVEIERDGDDVVHCEARGRRLRQATGSIGRGMSAEHPFAASGSSRWARISWRPRRNARVAPTPATGPRRS